MTLGDLACLLDAAAMKSKKLDKQRLLAERLAQLNQTDLQLAVRYVVGRAFAAIDERVLLVSSATITDVILALLNVDRETFRTLAIHHGETPQAIGTLWKAMDSCPGTEVSLAEIQRAFDDIADASTAEEKKSHLRSLFLRCRTPRQAVYLAKIILGDMRTGIKEGVVQAAIAQAFDVPLSDVLRAQLLTGDMEQVALLARENRLNEARFKLFQPLQFMLASPIETPADAPGDWIIEDKLDGIRAQVHHTPDQVQIYTRTLDRIDPSFPDVVAQVRQIGGDWLVDGEIVPWRDGRALAFSVLQKRLGRKQVTDRQLADAPARLIAFDLLYQDGQLLLDEPLVERQKRLRDLATLHRNLIVLPASVAHTPQEVTQAFERARQAGNEGLMLKNPDSPYTPGRRGGQWLKLKSHLPTLDCVVTSAEYGHGKRRGLLSDYTFSVWSGETLVTIGKAYSGVTDAEIAMLTERFLSISTSDNGRVFQVQPQVVLEIAFDQITRSKRHNSGYALRFPRIKRLRFDKRPQDADTIQRVEQIYQSRDNLGRSDPPTDLQPTLFDL